MQYIILNAFINHSINIRKILINISISNVQNIFGNIFE